MNLARRLFRFVKDPRYRLLYDGPRKDAHELCDMLSGRLLTADLCAPRDVPRCDLFQQVTARFWDEIAPRWEWPDYLGNFLFVIACWHVAFWASFKFEILWPLPLYLVLFSFRSFFSWVRHSEEQERLYWRLQCEAII